MSIEIIRKKGKYKNKYGIYLENLPGYCQQVLIDNPLSRSSFENDDQFTQVIFKMTEMSISHKNKYKFYYNPYSETISQYNEILDLSRLVEWECSICKKEIQAEISSFSINN